jgi:hypothetical protein
MSSALVPKWSPQQKAAFGKGPLTFAHRLVETGLFSDEALAEALDRCPPELYDINLFEFDAEGQHVMTTGTRGRLGGAAVLDGLKQGRVWMQMRRATQQFPAWGAAIDQAYREIAAEAGAGFRPMGVSGQLLLSAPGAAVPMHADAPLVILFHLRGRKRIWIYPDDEAHMPRRSMEAIVMRQQTEDLPYSREMDANAVVFDLEPGMAVSWPLHAPHRVENLDSACLSLTTEFQTWRTRITNGAYFTNGVLRRAGLPVAPIDRTPAAARAVLWAASLALRRMNLVEDRISSIERKFDLDEALPSKAA